LLNDTLHFCTYARSGRLFLGAHFMQPLRFGAMLFAPSAIFVPASGLQGGEGGVTWTAKGFPDHTGKSKGRTVA